MSLDPITSHAGCRISPDLRRKLEAVAREREWPLALVLREAFERFVEESATAKFVGGSQTPPRIDGRSRWTAPSG